MGSAGKAEKNWHAIEIRVWQSGLKIVFLNPVECCHGSNTLVT